MMTRFPWYLSVGLAIICYFGLKYGGGLLLGEGHRLAGLFELFAPLVAMAWLLLAGKQLSDGVEPEEREGDERQIVPDEPRNTDQ